MSITPVFVLLLLTLTSNAFALKRVKQEPEAANGRCLPATAGASRNVSARMTDGKPVDPAVLSALQEVIGTIETIGAGRFDLHQGAIFEFSYTAGPSHHDSGTQVIHLNPGSENRLSLDDDRFGGIMNRAVLAHELAHYISLRDGFRVQLYYQTQVPKPCLFTEYSKKLVKSKRDGDLRAEEFAEVFAAYITNPSLLSNCKKARDFMAFLFRENPVTSCAERKRSSRAPASVESVKTVD